MVLTLAAACLLVVLGVAAPAARVALGLCCTAVIVVRRAFAGTARACFLSSS